MCEWFRLIVVLVVCFCLLFEFVWEFLFLILFVFFLFVMVVWLCGIELWLVRNGGWQFEICWFSVGWLFLWNGWFELSIVKVRNNWIYFGENPQFGGFFVKNTNVRERTKKQSETLNNCEIIEIHKMLQLLENMPKSKIEK